MEHVGPQRLAEARERDHPSALVVGAALRQRRRGGLPGPHEAGGCRELLALVGRAEPAPHARRGDEAARQRRGGILRSRPSLLLLLLLLLLELRESVVEGLLGAAGEEERLEQRAPRRRIHAPRHRRQVVHARAPRRHVQRLVLRVHHHGGRD